MQTDISAGAKCQCDRSVAGYDWLMAKDASSIEGCDIHTFACGAQGKRNRDMDGGVRANTDWFGKVSHGQVLAVTELNSREYVTGDLAL